MCQVLIVLRHPCRCCPCLTPAAGRFRTFTLEKRGAHQFEVGSFGAFESGVPRPGPSTPCIIQKVWVHHPLIGCGNPAFSIVWRNIMVRFSPPFTSPMLMLINVLKEPGLLGSTADDFHCGWHDIGIPAKERFANSLVSPKPHAWKALDSILGFFSMYRHS